MGTTARKFFISYSHAEAEERALAKWFHEALLRAGHQSFIDAGIPLGAKWSEEVERNLTACDCFIALLSEAAVKSEMVIEEVRRANSLRRQLIPVLVRFDGDFGYHLGAIINPLQWERWESKDDSKPILKKILHLAGGSASPQPVKQPAKRRTAKPRRKTALPRPAPMASPQPSGSMWADDPLYLSRDADATAIKLAANQGVTLVIEAPRQIGKSSLLQRYLAECHRTGKRTALVDLSGLDFSSYDGLLTEIVAELSLELDITASSTPAIINQQQFTHWVQQRVLTSPATPVVLAFDEADSIFAQDYRQKFFAVLRSWHNRRARAGSPWRKLDLALVISTEPHLLIDKPTLSPFNVGNRLKLRPFTPEECYRLNQLHHHLTGRQLDETQVRQLRDLLGGQPYLTRLAYHLMLVDQTYSFDDLTRAAEANETPFADHLRALLSRLRERSDYNLAAAFRQIIRDGQTGDQAAVARLKAAGLVREEDDRVVPANGLYARFFGRVL